MPELGPGVRITNAALSQLVTTAAETVSGARVRRPKRRVDVQVDAGEARVELELAVPYGSALQEVGRAVQEVVATALRTMCGLEPASIDVAIEELE